MTTYDITTAVGMSSMMDLYKEAATSEIESESSGDVNVSDMIPRVSLNKKTSVFDVVMSKEPVTPENGRQMMYFAFVRVQGAKALYAPDALKEEFKRPICSTGWISPTSAKRSQCSGTWQVNEHIGAPVSYVPPEDSVVEVGCSACPWGRFDSAAKFDEKKEGSRGKACGDSRTYFLIPVKRTVQLPVEGRELFAFTPTGAWESPINPFGIGTMSLSMGSNSKPVEFIGKAPMNFRVGLSAVVFRCKVSVKKGGGYDVAELDPEVAGLLEPSFWVPNLKDSESHMHKWVANFIEDNKRRADVTFTPDTESETIINEDVEYVVQDGDVF